jgi:hypothetical protein
MKRYGVALFASTIALQAVGAPVDMVGAAQPGAEPAGLLPMVGSWLVKRDGNRQLVALDGSRWTQRTASPRIDELAAAAFAQDAASFAGAV